MGKETRKKKDIYKDTQENVIPLSSSSDFLTSQYFLDQ